LNVTAAACACALDDGVIPEETVVLDKSTCTRHFVEQSGLISLLLPPKGMTNQEYCVGSDSAYDVPNKLD
jgi:hypothetical protein